MAEIGERIPQQRVLRLEPLDELRLPFDRLHDSLGTPIDLHPGVPCRSRAGPPQGRGGVDEIVDGADERVVVAQRPGARAKDIALQGRFAEGQGPHGLERPLVPGGVRHGALQGEGGQAEQQPADERDDDAELACHGSSSPPAVSDRP